MLISYHTHELTLLFWERSRRQWQKSQENSHRNQPPWERAIKQGKTQNPIILKTYYQVKNPLRVRQARSLQNNDDLKKFLKEVKSSDAIGFGGYLESYHLIPLDKQFLASHKLNEIDGNLTSLNDV